ncbi:MAG: arylesterase [Candidatus Thiodiazotropha sp.]|jgi:acyl-CoA thioesterase I
MKKSLLTFLLCWMLPLTLWAQEPVRLLVLGDSLSAGYGVARGQRWVDLLADQLKRHCDAFQVINASVSGDTSGGGLSRLPKLLEQHHPDLVIIELGGNDGLRGINLRELRANLQHLVQLAKQTGARVLLLGMRLPPNYGPDFVQAFHQIYFDVAKAESVPLVAFFLEGVALDPKLMQADGIHPNDQAQPIMKDNVWVGLKPIIDDSGLIPQSCLEANSPSRQAAQ